LDMWASGLYSGLESTRGMIDS